MIPSSRAVETARFLVDAYDVHEDVMLETLEAAATGGIKESGRTVCGFGEENIDGPLGRFDRSVELAGCPSGGGTAIIHTHVTQDQLLAPEHSIPDTANVIFGGVSASMVIGTESNELLLEPENPEEAQQAFRDALGAEVYSAREAVEALSDGRVTDYSDARQRIRDRLGPLYERVPSYLSYLTREVYSLTDSGNISAYYHVERSTLGTHLDSISETNDQNAEALASTFSAITGDQSFTQFVVGTALGGIISAAAVRYVLGPRK